MIIPIAQADYVQHLCDFRRVVQDVFPMLSVTPSQTENFLADLEEPGENQTVFVVQTHAGQAFGRRIGWSLKYLIPSDWDRRYEIFLEALPEIKSAFLDSGEEKLTLSIRGGVPSLTLYFAGMLPALGFEIQPGDITLQAPEDLLGRLTLPTLPLGVREMAFDASRLPEYASVHTRAHAALDFPKPPSHRETDWAETLADVSAHEDIRNTWIGLEYDEQIVASCYGGCRPERWGEIMSVEELAVLPELSHQGLGRYALIRCLQELQRQYGAPGRVFQIGTWRHLGPRPLRLYLGLGFQVSNVMTLAVLRKAQ
ncbi:MAG: hypothetical protein JWQ02_1710 [Capsulimonas sp.]|nr:hypothetical protein [Capsulimonas sp.]